MFKCWCERGMAWHVLLQYLTHFVKSRCWELDNCLTTQCFPDKLALKSLTHDRISYRYICLTMSRV